MFEEILLENGFIEKMGTTWRYKEVSQICFRYSTYLQNTF